VAGTQDALADAVILIRRPRPDGSQGAVPSP
jgi:hypothetical protein